MKRSGVETRKRTGTTIVENERPRGPLTDEEIAAVRKAYQDGYRGQVIMGMCGEERIIPMLVPETVDTPAQDRLPAIRAELRRLGCDGYHRCRAGRSN